MMLVHLVHQLIRQTGWEIHHFQVPKSTCRGPPRESEDALLGVAGGCVASATKRCGKHKVSLR